MAKNKQSIKFEAEVSGFKKEIEEMRKSITSLNKELKLNQEQLKGNENDSNLLTTRVETLSREYEQQTKVVENTNKVYEKSVELFGENSREAQTWKDKLVEAETKQQKIKNSLDEANKKLREQSSNLIENGKEWQEHGEKISKVGDKIEKAGNKLSIVSAGIGAIAGGSLKASLDFESAFAGVEKTVDGTTEQLANLKQGILDMSIELPSSAVEISAVAESAGQLGIQTDNVLAFTRTMIDLGNSTNLSADEASSSLAKFANIVNMSTDDYDKLGSVIVDLGNNFATTERDIVEMGTRLASTGELTGLSESQIMGLATAISSVGIEAEAGGSAMSKLLQKMSTAVETGKSGKLSLEDLAKVSGKTAKEFKKAFQEDSAQALSSFIEGLNNTEQNGKSAIAVLQDLGLTDVRMTNTVLSLSNAHGVMSNALKTADKAWKENKALTVEANKRYGTTESQLKMLKNEVVKLGIEFGNQLAPSLRQIIKDSKPILDTVSSAIKKFSELDSTTKQNIVRAGAFVTAIGPVTKVLGQVTSGVGSVTSSIGKVSEAVGVMKTGVKSANSEVNMLASTFTTISGTAGVATLGITALAVSVGAVIAYYKNATKETDELKKSTDESLKSYNDCASAINNNMQAKLNDIDRSQILRQELEKIVDENGKIKEGYEARAKVIVNELSKSLGTEIKITDNVIDKYKDLQKEIDKLILKKKAEAILSANEEKYTKAWNNRTQKAQELLDLEVKINEEQKKLDSLNESLKNDRSGSLARSFKFELDISATEKNLENLRNSYNNTKKEVEGYTRDINDYNYASQLVAENTTESLTKLIDSTGRTYQKNGETVAITYKQMIQEQQTYLSISEELQKQAIDSNNVAEEEKTKKQIEETKTRIENLIEELESHTSLVEENSPDIVDAWKQLATDSYDVYAKKLAKMPPDMQTKIQELTGEIVYGTPGAEHATNELATKVTDELEKSTEARKSALETLQGFMSGLTDEEQKELLKNAGIKDIDKVMQGLKEGNLSEEEGTSVLKGILAGLNNKDWNDQLKTKASSLARGLSNLLKITPTINPVQTTTNVLNTIKEKISGHADGLAYVPYNNYVARLHEGERVLSKKENAEYIRNNISNKSSRNVTVNIYPQTMTEGVMYQISRFVNKEWGGKS